MAMEHTGSVRIRLGSSSVVLMLGVLLALTFDLLVDPSLVLQCILLCVSLLAGMFLIWTIRYSIVIPLLTLQRYAMDITAGGKPACPMGAMPKEFDALRKNICLMVENLVESVDNAGKSEVEARRYAEENERSLRESKAAEANIRELLEDMNLASRKASVSASNIFAGVRELSQNMESVDRDVCTQRDRIESMTMALARMNEAIRDIAQNTGRAAEGAEHSKENARDGAQGVREAVASIDRVKLRMLKLKDTMTALGDQARGIGQVMGVISDIADQTNLLALNAAIEAARAGDAGRGFAVVADEVRKLAEKTMAATKEVGSSVQSIQEHTRENIVAVDSAADEIVESARIAETSAKAVESIVDTVQSAAQEVAAIASTSEEQSTTSDEINKSVSEVNLAAQQTAESVNRSLRVLVEISGLADELDSIIQAMASGRLSGVTSSDELMSWTDELSVGVKLIDEQHKVLLGLINELHAAMRARKSESVLAGIVARLKEYTVKHFSQEEKFFDQFGYSETAAHKEMHRKLVEQVLAFETELKAGRAKVTLDVMRFLKDWLTSHIMGADKRYGPFLNRNGIS